MHDRSGFAANHRLDVVDRKAANGLAVDRVDDLTGLHSYLRRRHMLDRRNDDTTVLELIDVDADAAEVSSRERLVESLDLLRREIDGIRIVDGGHDSTKRG